MRSQAAEGIPVEVEATVLYYSVYPTHELFIHDDGAGIYVIFDDDSLDLLPGQRIQLWGASSPGTSAPIVKCTGVVKMGVDPLPGERTASMKDLLSGREDCNWLAIEGIVRQDQVVNGRREMVLDVGGRRIFVYFAGTLKALPNPGGLVGARIAVRGVIAGKFNDDGQIFEVHLFSPGTDYVRIISLAAPEIFDLPPSGYADLQKVNSDEQKENLVKVTGTVTYDRPGYGFCLTDGKQGLMVKSELAEQLSVGEVVDAVGFPVAGNHSVFLEDGLVRQNVPGSPPVVTSVSAEDASTGLHDAELVKIQARLADQRLLNDKQVLLLESNDRFFTARLPSDTGIFNGDLQTGDTLQLTGICSREELLGNFDKLGGQFFDFQLLLRSPEDVTIVHWWTNSRIFAVLVVASVGFSLIFFWIAALRRHVRLQQGIIEHQVRLAATLEERNRIARDLHDTLAQGFAGTAFVLEGIVTKLRTSDSQLKPHIDLALRMVRHGITQARLSLMNLRVDAPEDRDLVSTLEEAARELIAHSDVALVTDIQPPTEGLTPNIKDNLLRITVEAIGNSLRHGKPRKIQIKFLTIDRLSTLRICDDGLGFDPESVHLKTGHFGLLGMRERARQMQATLNVVSSPGIGTEVCLTFRAEKAEV